MLASAKKEVARFGDELDKTKAFIAKVDSLLQ